MKNIIPIAILSLIIPLFASGQDSQTINNFNQRLQNIYEQSDSKTQSRQIVFGTAEAIAAYQLGSFVSKRDKKGHKFIKR